MLGAVPFLVAYYTWRTTQGTELKAIIIYKALLDRRESIEMPVPLPAYLMENLDCKVVLVDLCFLPSASAKV